MTDLMQEDDKYLTTMMTSSMQKSKKLFEDSNPYLAEKMSFSDDFKRKIKMDSRLPPKPPVPSAFGQTSNESVKLLGYDGASEGTPSSSSSANSNVQLYAGNKGATGAGPAQSSTALTKKMYKNVPTPQWHAPWELNAVVSGHLGWVRSIAFDSSNEWFVTGATDRTIKVWDLAKCVAGSEGGLKLTLTGHISAIRGLCVSPRHPYLFSAGEDKMVKCWDLEYNKVIRHYHGHLSGVFCLALHPILDLLLTGGRDSVARVWDMRSKHQVHCLGGHTNAVSSLITSGVDPQVITASHDSTIKLWDLAAGKCMSTLTQHKKAVRSLAVNPREMSFVSGASDNLKKWQCRDGKFLKNMSGHNSPINALAVNEDGVLVSCGDNGSLSFWDYDSGYNFQKSKTIVQPGSLDAEAGIYAASFDNSGSLLVTCEADKTIKIWRESPNATQDTDPIDMNAWTKECLALKRY